MLDYFISAEIVLQVRLLVSHQLVKHPPLASLGGTTLINIVQAGFGLCVYLTRTLKALLLFLWWFWGLLRGHPVWSRRSGSLFAGDSSLGVGFRCPSACGRMAAGFYRITSTVGPASPKRAEGCRPDKEDGCENCR